jgi:hypothetical protein
MPQPNGQIAILPAKTITAALTGWTTDVFKYGNAFPKMITAWAAFTYGSGGTTAKAWLQTSFDNGSTWMDVMCFAFATTTAKKAAQVNNFVAQANVVTPTDATLADNTIVNGIIGPRLRLKVTTTGTYAGGTTLAVTAMIR